ncbi:hypothetical protein C2S53_014859 [Perilla frutescens var. hirtella]|uniref:Uncharacterized protein n=1 Tax=Perilla frutescens var. hirtella TaxID=608512 RepID=A0AAD4P7V3_PERFH|nr:hypothetical protein C2S53_014859 [Perilla frutescens var. hirtella]
MERRQLDFNAPLMSARRYSSPSKSSELVKRKVVEKPPPCKQQSLPPNKSNWECEEVTKPAAVPFHWEEIPGRPKDEVESQSHTPEESNTPRLPPARLSDAIRRNSGEIPKLPPGRLSGPSRYCSGERSNDQNIFRSQIEAFSFNDHASLLEKLNDSLNCKDDSDSESEDDAYSDALDTLSMTESWSFNYSVSGISGYQSSGVKPSGTFCIDKQTRDFMMNRFLPAAKAVVLETPEYAVKKSSVPKEKPPKQVKKAVSGEMKPSLRQYSSDALPYYNHYINNAESEDEDQESVAPTKKPGKAWGILPRFCVKTSLCLLNPLPALKLKPKSRTPSPSTCEVKRMSRNAHSGPLDKNACQVVHKKKSYSGLLSRDLPGIDNKFTTDSIDSHRSAGVSPLRRYRSGNISPYRNESPKSPFREGVGFLGVPKEVENFNAKIASSRKLFKALQDVSRNQINERASAPSPTADPVEKTVYVDYVKKKDLSSTKTKPSHTKSEQVVDTLEEGRKLISPKFGPTDKILPSTYFANAMVVKPNQTLYQESTKEVPCEAKFVKVESDNVGDFNPPVKSPLPPPLPKSPSESWLWRTLPSISLGNPFANSRHSSSSPLHPKKQGQKASATNTKWETIVKTSNLRHDHVRYSEELHRASYRPMKS